MTDDAYQVAQHQKPASTQKISVRTAANWVSVGSQETTIQGRERGVQNEERAGDGDGPRLEYEIRNPDNFWNGRFVLEQTRYSQLDPACPQKSWCQWQPRQAPARRRGRNRRKGSEGNQCQRQLDIQKDVWGREPTAETTHVFRVTTGSTESSDRKSGVSCTGGPFSVSPVMMRYGKEFKNKQMGEKSKKQQETLRKTQYLASFSPNGRCGTEGAGFHQLPESARTVNPLG